MFYSRYSYGAIGAIAAMGKTTIQVTEDLAEQLHDMKQRGDSYEDVIRRLLDGEGEAGAHAATERAERSVEDLDLPGDGGDVQLRREAIYACVGMLEAEGRVRKEDLLDLAVKHAGETYDSPQSLWKNCMGPALADVENVEAQGNSGWWRWTG